jgi:hypothetical protein
LTACGFPANFYPAIEFASVEDAEGRWFESSRARQFFDIPAQFARKPDTFECTYKDV